MREAGVTRIYLDVIDVEPTSGLLAYVAEEGLVPVLDEVCREPDHARLDPWVRAGLPVAVGNLSGLSLARECGALAETRSCIPDAASTSVDEACDALARLRRALAGESVERHGIEGLAQTGVE